MSDLAEHRICVGQIRQAHGLAGWVKVFSYTEPRTNLFDYGPFTAFTSKGTVTLEIESSRVQSNSLLVKFKSVADRTAADLLCGTDLYMPKDRLPALASDEYYVADLIGFEVLNTEHMPLGSVTGTMDSPAHLLLEVETSSGELILIPWHRQVVVEVNEAQKQIIAEWELI